MLWFLNIQLKPMVIMDLRRIFLNQVPSAIFFVLKTRISIKIS